jgi:hypothetical protein
MAALTCKIGASLSWDVVQYVRSQIEDLTVPFLIPDTTLASYIEAAAEEFSKWEPLGEHVVGNLGGTPPTSPLSTQVGVSRYSCSVGNGFAYPVAEITDVSFRPSGIFTAANDFAYLQLMPASAFSMFMSEDNLFQKPSSRIIRAEMFNELSHYSNGLYAISRDANGVKAIDIFPVPIAAGVPIFVRYTSSHIMVPVGTDPTYPTIPENLKRYFGKFALIEVLEQETDRLSRSSQLKAGQMQRWSNPVAIKNYAAELKADVEVALGSSVTVGMVSH